MNNNDDAPTEKVGQTNSFDDQSTKKKTNPSPSEQKQIAKPKASSRPRVPRGNVKPASKASASNKQEQPEAQEGGSSEINKPSSRRTTSKATSKNVKTKAALPANKSQLETSRVVEETTVDKPYNLHQKAEFWPEAWPDQAPETSSPEVSFDIDDERSAPVAKKQKRGSRHGYAESMTEAARPEVDEMGGLHLPLPPDVHDEQTDFIKTPDEPIVTEYTEDCDSPEEMLESDLKKDGKRKSVHSKVQSPPSKSGKKRKMYVSVLPGEQVEMAIVEDNQVQEYYVQMMHQLKTKGNIYKGVIHNVDANLQAAFVSYGVHKNGFLQIDEVHPEYYLGTHDPTKGKKYPLIQKVLKAGQEVLVQVVKEPTEGKGAFLSTYLSIPGRFLVLTPGRTQLGVSRKVENEGDRDRLRSLLEALPPQEGLGVIVRTASLSASKTSIVKDLQVLKRQWKDVRTRGSTEPAPCLVYEEPSLAGRAVRDYLSDDIVEISVDDEETAKEIKDTVLLIFPRRASANLVKLYNPTHKSMWENFGLQKQIEQIYSREVTLPSGGRLVFGQTEALMAIDINSGKIAGRNNFESMALRTNIEAAQVIAQQLRLRDIGGQIVIDFIEMRDRNHWRELEKVMSTAMKSDRALYDVAKVSSFGLMEVVRQRLGSSAISVTMETCPCCQGTGLRRNMEWQALNALREIRQLALHRNGNDNRLLAYETDSEIALYLLNNKRTALDALKERYGVKLEIKTK